MSTGRLADEPPLRNAPGLVIGSRKAADGTIVDGRGRTGAVAGIDVPLWARAASGSRAIAVPRTPRPMMNRRVGADKSGASRLLGRPRSAEARVTRCLPGGNGVARALRGTVSCGIYGGKNTNSHNDCEAQEERLRRIFGDGRKAVPQAVERRPVQTYRSGDPGRDRNGRPALHPAPRRPSLVRGSRGDGLGPERGKALRRGGWQSLEAHHRDSRACPPASSMRSGREARIAPPLSPP